MKQSVRSFIGVLAIPDLSISVWRGAVRPFTLAKYRIWGELSSVFIEPALTLFALSYGLGHFLPEINGRPYPTFVTPAVSILSAIFVSYWETSFGVFQQLRKPAPYWVALQSPITPEDLGGSEILFATLKGVASGLMVLVVAAVLGWIPSAWAWLAPIILFPSALLAAAFGLWVATRVKQSSSIMVVQSLILAPLAFWSDTVFSFSTWGLAQEWLVALSPVGHMVHALRSSMLGEIPAEFFLNLAVVWALACVFTNLSMQRFAKALTHWD